MCDRISFKLIGPHFIDVKFYLLFIFESQCLNTPGIRVVIIIVLVVWISVFKELKVEKMCKHCNKLCA